MENKRFFPHINALRFVAILSTVTGHWAMDSGMRTNALQLGQYGVDLFFTISGFLITLNLLEAQQQNSLSMSKKLGYFFLNRTLRIFPPYFLLLFVLFVIHFLFHITVWMKGTGVYYFTYTSNFLFYFKGFAPVSYLNHSWTLAVEEQFYVIWPFLVLCIPLRKTNYLIYAFILAGIMTHFFHSADIGEKYKGYVRFLPFANYHTIGTGALLAFIVTYQKNILSSLYRLLNPVIWIGIFLLSFYTKTSLLPGKGLALFQETVLCITTMSLVYNGWKGYKGWVKKLFDAPAIQYIGLISYGIYLFETPVSFLILNTFTKFQISFWGMPLLKIIAFASCTLLAAHFSYKYVELPILKFKKKYY
jgi:peptidoglycan/LPS O-acetylase OafA/YrhL